MAPPVYAGDGSGPKVMSFRKERSGPTAMQYVPGARDWSSQVKREPLDSVGIVSQAQRRAASLSSTGGLPTGQSHRLGFQSSDAMPVIMNPRVLFDAFQDTNRTGQLPNQLREGSMPLYFSLNRKYLTEFQYKKTKGYDGLGKTIADRGSRHGALSRELDGRGLGYKPQTEDDWMNQALATISATKGAIAGSSRSPERPRPATSLGTHAGPGPAQEGAERRPEETAEDDGSNLPVWQVIRSQTKGFPYWYNRLTGESRWLPPEDSLEMLNSKNSVAMPEDRSWFNYQTGYHGNANPYSTGRSVQNFADLRQKPDFLVEEPRGHKKVLQRRFGMPTEEGMSIERTSSGGQNGDFSRCEYPDKFAVRQNGTSWEAKLVDLIVQKCEEHSGRTVSMREAFMKLDRDKVGIVGVRNLQEVLSEWTGMSLSDHDMEAVIRKFNPRGDGKIRYLDVCAAMGDKAHPLGGELCVNMGSVESQNRGFKKVSIPCGHNPKVLRVDLTAM